MEDRRYKVGTLFEHLQYELRAEEMYDLAEIACILEDEMRTLLWEIIRVKGSWPS